MLYILCPLTIIFFYPLIVVVIVVIVVLILILVVIPDHVLAGEVRQKKWSVLPGRHRYHDGMDLRQSRRPSSEHMISHLEARRIDFHGYFGLFCGRFLIVRFHVRLGYAAQFSTVFILGSCSRSHSSRRRCARRCSRIMASRRHIRATCTMYPKDIVIIQIYIGVPVLPLGRRRIGDPQRIQSDASPGFAAQSVADHGILVHGHGGAAGDVLEGLQFVVR